MSSRLTVVLLSLSGLAACPGSLRNPDRFREDYCIDVTFRMIEQTCTLSGCHTTTDAAAGLDLESADLSSRLADQDASPDDDCSGEGKLIDPTDPPASLLYRKMAVPDICGEPMPAVGCCAKRQELDCLLEWISMQ